MTSKQERESIWTLGKVCPGCGWTTMRLIENGSCGCCRRNREYSREAIEAVRRNAAVRRKLENIFRTTDPQPEDGS